MIEKNYTIIDKAGIHARPATVLINAVSPFTSDVTMEYNGKQVNMKSIMGVMSLAVVSGATVKVVASGSDEADIIASIDNVMKIEGLGE